MYRMGKYLMMVTLCFCSTIGHTLNIDSLEALLPQLSGVELVKAKNDLAWELKTTDPDRARTYASQALLLSSDIEYTLGIADAGNQLAILERNNGNLDSAMVLFRQSLSARYALKDSGMIGGCLQNIASLFEKKGNLDSSIHYFEMASQYLNRKNDPERWGQLRLSVGSLHIKQGKYESAFKALSDALEIATETGNAKEIANSQLNLGKLYQNQLEWDAALSAYQKALAISEALEDYQLTGKAHNNIGTILYKNGDWATANKELSLAIAAYREANDQVAIARLWLNKANVQLEMGKIQKAIVTYKNALEEYKQMGLSLETANIWHQVGRWLHRSGQPTEAIKYYDSSLTIADSFDYLTLRIENYNAFAEAYIAVDAYSEAIKFQALYEDAMQTFWSQYQASKALELKTKEQEKQLFSLQLENEKVRAEQERQSAFAQQRLMWNYFLVLVVVAGGVLFFVVFKLYKKNQQAKLAEKQKKISQQKVIELIREQELKSMYATLDGQETERRRIAQELHDAVGTTLSMAKLFFQNMEDHLTHLNQDVSNEYTRAIGLLDNSVGEIRRISHNLASGVLSKLGLQHGLDELLDSVKTTGQLSVNYHIYGFEQRFPIGTEMQLYRVLQELIANVLKHSKATQVTVQLIEKDNNLTIMVEDNGIGFDPNNQAKGIGLQNVEARLHKLEADWTLDTSLGRGTTITISLDIPPLTPLEIT